MDRLERLEDLFTEWMIGFALALLIAVGFAPNLIGGETIDPFINWQTPKKLLYFVLFLFCVKIIHEQSVFRYHLKKNNIRLNTDTVGNVIWFASRILVPFCLYLLIITIFISKNNNPYSFLGFSGLLIAAYIAPDWVLYKQLLDSETKKSLIISHIKKKPVWIWLFLDIVNILGIIYLLLAKDNIKYAGLAAFIILTALPILYFVSNKIKQHGYDYKIPYLWCWVFRIVEDFVTVGLEKKKLLMIGAYILLWFGTVLGLILAGNFDLTYFHIIIFVFLVNILDWFLNCSFFFGDLKDIK